MTASYLLHDNCFGGGASETMNCNIRKIRLTGANMKSIDIGELIGWSWSSCHHATSYVIVRRPCWEHEVCCPCLLFLLKPKTGDDKRYWLIENVCLFSLIWSTVHVHFTHIRDINKHDPYNFSKLSDDGEGEHDSWLGGRWETLMVVGDRIKHTWWNMTVLNRHKGIYVRL